MSEASFVQIGVSLNRFKFIVTNDSTEIGNIENLNL